MVFGSCRLRWLLGLAGAGLLLVVGMLGAVQPTEVAQPAGPTRQMEGAQPTESAQGAEVARSTEAVPPTEAARPTEVAQPTGSMPPGMPHRAVPVLMYHVIAPGPNSLFVPPEEFEGHLKYLADQGYQSISLAQLAAHFEGGAALPERPIVLTFDDGYVSVHEAALPLLQRYRMTGTFFIITDLVGNQGYVTWEQLGQMADAGMEIGSHTVSHPDLSQVTGQRLTDELGESRRILAERLSVSVDFLAYPAGRFDDETVEAMRSHYRGAVTTLGGMATACQDPLLWHRVRVNDGLGPEQLGGLLRYWEEEAQANPCEPAA